MNQGLLEEIDSAYSSLSNLLIVASKEYPEGDIHRTLLADKAKDLEVERSTVLSFPSETQAQFIYPAYTRQK